MNNYAINITSEITEEKLQKGTFIFIYRVSRIPPHIGIITNGLLYDITMVGPNMEMPVSDFYKTAFKRKTEVLFVELAPSEVETNDIIIEKVRKHWKVTLETSCLIPVKEFLHEVYQVEVLNLKFIFELLPVLYDEGLIKDVFELNLSHKIKNNIFELIKYEQEDIEKCITILNRKEKSLC